MQAEEVQAWLETPTPSTRDCMVVVPDVSSDDPSLYLAVPERIPWQTHERATDTNLEQDNERDLLTVAIGQFLLIILFVFCVIGTIIQFILEWCRA